MPQSSPAACGLLTLVEAWPMDRLFRAAELRIGAKTQTVVRITKGEPRTGLAAIFGG